ncbi:transglutaminase-like cysteine peptidase, partial [Oleiphilus sp. HI0132]
WATPLEFLATNAGDCEDFSIAKYFTLREMGIPDDMIKITYVKALELNQAHMVLAYYPTPDAEPLILDNLINEIKPAGQRTD